MAKQSIKLLLADDEEIFAGMLKDILENHGYFPDTVFRGDDAIKKIQENNYDVILTDIRMPGNSGLDVLKAAKEKDADVQVIVISAYGDAGNILEALRRGACDFLPKPIEITGIVPNFIDKAAEKRRLLKENRELLSHLAKRTRELEKALELIKRQQEELVHSERLKVFATMSACMAHEINNPLALISANSQTLEKYLDALDKQLSDAKIDKTLLERTREDIGGILKRIRNGVVRVSQITMSLRAFSRREPGVVHENTLKECVSDAMNILAPRLSNVHVNVSLEDAGHIIRANRQNLIHAIMNFIHNSLDATEGVDNPTIDVASSVVEDQIVLTIKDNGIGMSKEVQSKIFEPFFTTKPMGKGTGLGMSIAHGIIEESGGRIAIQSEPKTGTIITVKWFIKDAKE